jgi:hypothetical protein
MGKENDGGRGPSRRKFLRDAGLTGIGLMGGSAVIAACSSDIGVCD